MTDTSVQEMPNVIKRFEQLWFGVVLLSTISVLIVLAQTPIGSTNGLPFEEMFGIAILVLIVCLVVWLVTSVSRRRRSWAKWILIFMVCAGIAGHLRNPSFAFQDGQLAGILTWTSSLLQLVAISLLFTPAANQWLSSKAIPTAPPIGTTSAILKTDLPSSDAICPQCHKALSPTAKFCSECGSAATTRLAALKVLGLVAAFTILGAIGAGLYWGSTTDLFGPNLSCTSKANQEAVLKLVKEHPFEILRRDKRIETNATFVKYAFYSMFVDGTVRMSKPNLSPSDDAALKASNAEFLAKFYQDADVLIDPMIIGSETSRQSQCVTYAHMLERSSGRSIGNVKIDVILTNQNGDVAITIHW